MLTFLLARVNSLLVFLNFLEVLFTATPKKHMNDSFHKIWLKIAFNSGIPASPGKIMTSLYIKFGQKACELLLCI